MRLSMVKLGKDETIFYNLGIFSEDEEIIIFPAEEFLNFYDELTGHIKALNNILKNTDSCPPMYSSLQALEHMRHFIKAINHELYLLTKFEMQTTLESFRNQEQKSNNKEIKELSDNERLQCLIGL
jgi:hypothetical protein